MVGGRWYGEVDEAQSDLLRELVWDDATRNTFQFDDYFRFDLKTNLTWNRPSTTHELGIDWVNVLGTENVLKLTYAPDDASKVPCVKSTSWASCPSSSTGSISDDGHLRDCNHVNRVVCLL